MRNPTEVMLVASSGGSLDSTRPRNVATSGVSAFLHDAELPGHQGAGDGDKGEGDHAGGDEAACLFYEHVGRAAMGGGLKDWPVVLNNFVRL
jgi:hypothetical protein